MIRGKGACSEEPHCANKLAGGGLKRKYRRRSGRAPAPLPCVTFAIRESLPFPFNCGTTSECS